MANAVEPVNTVRQEVTLVRRDLEKMESQFHAALPKHIPAERFLRVVMTAIQNNSDLVMKCDRPSLFNACVRAAQDGLLPDGREGAIVPYKGKAQWMPMVYGLRKKVRNSGEIRDWEVQLVHARDDFAMRLGDNARIDHAPFLGGDRGEIVGAYSLVHFRAPDGKDAGSSREWMSIVEIEAVRKQSSRAQSGPWQVAAFYGEMCRKTVARRHAKSLPMSSDLDDLMRRDDELYDLKAEQDPRPARRPSTLGDALDQIVDQSRGKPAETEGETINQETGEVQENAAEENKPTAESSSGAAGADQSNAAKDSGAADAGRDAKAKPAETAAGSAKSAGVAEGAAGGNGAAKAAPAKAPATEREYRTYALAWIQASKDGRTIELGPKGEEYSMSLRERWTGKVEKGVRNKANVSSETREEIFELLVGHADAIAKAGG